VADQAALTSAQLSRYDALLRVANALGSHRTLSELFHVLAEHLHALVPFDYLALLLHDQPHDEMKLVLIEPADLEPPFTSKPVAEQGPATAVWETQQGAVIPVPRAGELPPALAFLRDEGRTMTCWLPMTTAHRRVGVLAFGSRSPVPYTGDVLAFMEQIAGIVAVAVENGINREQAQHYEFQLREERDRLQFIIDVNNLLVSRLDYRGLVEAIAGTVQRIVAADHIGVALYDEETRELRADVIYNNKARGFTMPGGSLSLDSSAAGVTFQRGVPARYRREQVETLGWEGATAMKTAGVESICCLPLVTSKAKLGTLLVGSANPEAFSDDDLSLLGHASRQIAIAIENARAYEKVASLNSQLLEEKEYLEVELRKDFGEIVGASPALKKVLKAVKTVAPTDSTVMILGETGTGKELIARAIHNLSPRRARTFVRTNVAALPATLLEAELFGHEKGAFTGAVASRAGRLEVANRGTLFLDEVGDIPAEMQPKLLRVLQEREFERLGSTRTQHVDVRIVAATHRDLEHMAEEGSFRSDLFYRLNVFPITVPPLRERVDDIPALARHFTGHYARRMGRPVPAIPDAALQALQQWTWPGNIRELQNVIERAVILTSGPNLQLPYQDLQPKSRRAAPDQKVSATLKDSERDTIVRALRESAGVIAGPGGAAAKLGLRRTTLHSKMRKLGIDRPSF
jgi:formate hydrogenlyase transcriptional activator